jgi:hypothetical protein
MPAEGNLEFNKDRPRVSLTIANSALLPPQRQGTARGFGAPG